MDGWMSYTLVIKLFFVVLVVFTTMKKSCSKSLNKRKSMMSDWIFPFLPLYCIDMLYFIKFLLWETRKSQSTLLSGILLDRKIAAETRIVMDWPPRSPDLNIIETVWDHLDKERNKRLNLKNCRKKPNVMYWKIT